MQTNEGGVKFFRLKNHEREARVIFPEKLDDFICLQGTLREMPDNFEARVVFGGLFFRLIAKSPIFTIDLGVLFDSKLSFNFHVNEIIKTSYKNLGFITRNSREFTDIGGLMLLFNALVKSKLEYASIVWQPGYNIYTDSLENIQRRFLKFLSYKLDGVYPPIGIPHRQLLDRFSVPSLCERRTVHSLIFLSKLIMNKVDCPQIIEQLAFNIPRIEGRFSKTFYLAVPRTNTLKFSPLYTMCENCNNLQDSIDIFNCSYNSLKNKLYNNS